MTRWLALGFGERILPFDSAAARAYAEIAPPREEKPMIDRRIAALAFALALAVSAPAAAADYAWPVVRVVDGDMVEVDASADLPPELARLMVRLRGVDTPEKGHRARCLDERMAGHTATAFTKAALAGASRVVVRDPEWGKWGGRVIADVVVDGRSLAAALIAAGQGRPYIDDAEREDWCPMTR